MGGKSYYCDYCDCYMKNDINVRKNHNNGMIHNVAKANYLQKLKGIVYGCWHTVDPLQIVTEEKNKIPCKRFSNNKECQFGFFCRFSHYSLEELAYLEWIGAMRTKTNDSILPEYDYIVFMETWLVDKFVTAEIYNKYCAVHRLDRRSKSGHLRGGEVFTVSQFNIYN